MVGRLSPPQRLLLGIPKKIAKIEKNRKRAGDDEKRGKKRKPLSDQDIFSSWLSLLRSITVFTGVFQRFPKFHFPVLKGSRQRSREGNLFL